MGLLSIFQRKTDAAVHAGAASDSGDGVQQARTRARQRLIGAVVLVVIGIIGFPLVFETQPRPIPVDIPIEIPRRDGAPALVMPTARPVTPAPSPASNPPQPKAAAHQVITETRADAGREVTPTLPTSAAVSVAERPTTKPAPKPAPAEVIEAPRKVAALPAKALAPSTDATRAKALLEGGEPAKPEGTRFVVQVGAFADAAAARETRLKVEKLGLKTYTQLAETAAGNRIRVRAGPFATRDEAESALAKAKAAGMNAVVLTL